MNVLGEIGSPCLVPIVVKNHSPITCTYIHLSHKHEIIYFYVAKV